MTVASLESEKSRTTIEKVPNELLLQVLEYLYYTKTHVPDHRAMASYSLISKAWAPAAQLLLFHEVYLSQVKHVKALEAAISRKTDRGRYLSNSVRILNIETVYQDSWRDHKELIKVSHLGPLFVLCPGLYELSIRFYDVESLSARIISDWKKHAPPIKTLRINNLNSYNSSFITQMVGIWPSVQFLTIKGDSFSQKVPDVPLPLTLIEFGWYAKNKPEEDYLKWILGNSDKTLRAFHLVENGSAFSSDRIPINHFALSHSAHLRSLRIRCITPEQLRLFPRLEELVLFDTRQLTIELVNALPQSISHVAFVLSSTNELYFLDRMSYKTLPNLRAISCFNSGIPSATINKSSLPHEFGLKNVSLKFYAGTAIVLQALKDDSIPELRPTGVPVRKYPGTPSVEVMRERNQDVSDRVAEYEARVQRQNSRFLGAGRLLPAPSWSSGDPQLRVVT